MHNERVRSVYIHCMLLCMMAYMAYMSVYMYVYTTYTLMCIYTFVCPYFVHKGTNKQYLHYYGYTWGVMQCKFLFAHISKVDMLIFFISFLVILTFC